MLEQTVQAIQDENGKLRARLEHILASSASANASQPQSMQPEQPTHEGSWGDNSTLLPDINGALPDSLANHASSSKAPLPATPHPKQSEYEQELGLDFTALAPLQNEVQTLRRQVKQQRSTSGALSWDSSARSVEAQGHERQALVSFIKHLKTSRDEIERERKVLEAEIKARRAMLEQTEKGEKEESDVEQSTLGVERALLEVRRWMGHALKSWQSVSFSCLYSLFSPPPYFFSLSG